MRAADETTRWRRIAGGDLGAGRFVAAELISQTWRGAAWRHQFAIALPARLAAEGSPLVLGIDGGSTPEGEMQPPARQLPILAAIAEAAGMPAAVVRQVPNQPLEGGRHEDDLALEWTCDATAGACELVAAPAPTATLLWTAASATKDFRPAMWQSRPVTLAAGRCRELVERPAAGLRAALLECRYDRRPLPLHLSTGPVLVAAR